MILFSFLKDIIYRKEGKLLDDPENEQEFQPYLINRWLSMYSSDFVKLLNNTINPLYSVFDTKKDWYKIFLTTIPKTYFKKIKYIKKNKKNKDKKDEEEMIAFIAKNKQMSKREVKMYIDMFDINIKNIKRVFDVK